MYCECGCGQVTKVWDYNTKSLGRVKGEHRRFVKGHHLLQYKGEKHSQYGKSGELSPVYKGGRHVEPEGYVLVRAPEHPLAYQNGYIYEHRLIACQLWGVEAVRDMDVHHINEDPGDNRPENLQLLTPSEHMTLHHERRRNATCSLQRDSTN